MRLGGEIDHRAWPVLGQQARHQSAVGDIPLHKDVAWVALQRGQVLQIAGVGQLVQVEHRLIGLCQPVKHKVGADKTGAARHQNHVFPCQPMVPACGGPGGL